MANLLSWAGNLANRVGNTINNDVIQPVVRDVYQPAVRDVVRPIQRNVIQPVVHTDQRIIGGARSLGQGIASSGIPLGVEAYNRIVAPTLHLPQQTFNPNQFSHFGTSLLGNKPVLSPTQTFKATKQAGHGTALAAGLAGLTAAGALPGGAPEKNLAKAAIEKAMPKDFLAQNAKQVAQNARILNTTKPKAAAVAASKLPPEQKLLVNKALSKMPSIPEVPKTSAKPGQQLSPVSKLPTAQKLFANKVTALRKINTPSSHAAADRIVAAEADRQALQAQWMHSIPTVRSLNKNEFTNFVDTVEKNAKAQSPKVAQAVKEWRTLSPKVAKTAESQGFLLNGARSNYFPHQYDVVKEGSTQWDNQIQKLMDSGKIKHETAVDIMRQHNNDIRAGHFGSFENSRESTMPGYHKDIHAINSYLGRGATKIAQSRQFGPDAQVADKLVENIRIEGGDAEQAKAALRNYLTSPDKGHGAGALATARGVFGAASLSKAPISHLGQTSNVAVEAGVKNTLKGWGQFLSRNSEAKDFVDKVGTTHAQELHSYRDQFTGVKGGISKVTAAGLTPVMKMNRAVTALAGREYGHYLAKTGNEGALRGLGVTGDIGKTLTQAQEVQAARGLSNHTMFNGSRATTPIYAETPVGKTVGQFRTAYAYKQTGFIYNQVIKAARNGDLKPLARFLGVSAGVGAGTVAIKNKISGNNEGPGGVALDAAATLGGIPGEAAMSIGRYGVHRAGGLTQTVAGQIAPLASEAMTLTSNLDSLIHGKPAPLGRTALKAVPLAGGRLSKALLPSQKAPTAATNPSASGSTSGTPAAMPKNSAQAEKQSTTIVNNLKNNAKQGDYQLVPLPNGKFAAQLGDGSVSTHTTKAQAALAIQKDQFVQSGKPQGQIGNNIWQLDTNGNPTHTTVTAYQYSVNSATMTELKNNGDLQGWMDTAQSQLQNIAKQLKDPSTTPLKAIQLKNEAATLQKDIAKYQGYGGFTKATGSKTGGKSASSKAKSYTLKLPSSAKTKAPKVKASFKTTTKGTTFKPKAPPKAKVPATPKIRVSKRKLA